MSQEKQSKRSSLWLLLIAAMLCLGLLTAVLAGLAFRIHRPATITWQDFQQHTAQGDFRTITVRDDGSAYELTGHLKTPPDQTRTTRLPTSALDGPGWATLNDLATKGKANLEFEPSAGFPFH
jgi:hypothetical protein